MPFLNVHLQCLTFNTKDNDFLNAMNPSGGQFSSLSDFITLTQTLLNPRHLKSQLTQHSLNRWLQQVHAFEDNWTEMGILWEIIKARDSNGRLRRIYWKSESSILTSYIVPH